MPDQEFKLLITGDASGAAAATQQAATGLKTLKVDTSGLSDETKKSLGMLALTNEETKKMGGAAEGASGKFKITTEELRRMGNELGRVTGFSMAGNALFSGMAAAAFGAGMAINFLRQTWEDIQDSIKGPINLEVHDGTAKIEAAATAWNQYAEARKKVLEAYNSAGSKEIREEQDLANKLSLLKQILAAEEKEAQAELATHKNQMSPQAYAKAQSDIQAAFEGKNAAADAQNEQDIIAAKESEAKALAKDAADKKAKGEAMSLGNVDAQKTAQENIANAEGELNEVNDRIAMIKRVHSDAVGNEPEEYKGITGQAQKISDFWTFYKHYGFNTASDALKLEEQRKAQAEVAVTQGVQAQEQSERLKKQKADLLAQAGDESAQSETLMADVARERQDAKTKDITTQGTTAITASATALGQMHDAEANNTLGGQRDAVAALQAGNAAARQVNAGIKALGDSNKELHGALEKALADLAAENKKLAARLAQGSYNSK